MTNIIVETDRLVLRRMVAVDIAALVALWRDPEVTRHIGGPRPEEELANALGDPPAVDDPFDLFVLATRAGDEIVGHAGILEKIIDGKTEHELIYVLARSAWGQGYATEIGHALLAHARETLGLSRLVALIAPDNRASQRVAEKLGFVREQVLIRNGKEKLVYAKSLKG